MSDAASKRLGPYFMHGPTLRRLGLGEDTKSEEHKARGIMMRGCFRGNHAHAHGKRWPHNPRCNTPVYRRNHPPKRKGAICFCIPPKSLTCAKKESRMGDTQTNLKTNCPNPL